MPPSAHDRIAAIDIGTNAVLMLVAEVREGALVALADETRITRLGEGVDRTRTLADAAIERTLAALDDYARLLAHHRVSPSATDVVGTSAMRDAGGGATFCEAAARRLGQVPRVLTGDQEAALTARGALSDRVGTSFPALLFDIGGGSTELIVTDERGAVSNARSLDIGSVRLAERHLDGDGCVPTPASEAIAQSVEAALGSSVGAFETAIGVAGTVLALEHVAHGRTSEQPHLAHGTSLSMQTLSDLTERLLGMTGTERRAIGGLHPLRADVLPVGALITRSILRWAAPRDGRLHLSNRGVRWGLALERASRL